VLAFFGCTPCCTFKINSSDDTVGS
jgi:hypothetical protein